MYNKGDKIVEILTGKIYTFYNYFDNYSAHYYEFDPINWLSIYEDKIHFHKTNEFISLKEYRKEKLNHLNICSKKEIK